MYTALTFIVLLPLMTFIAARYIRAQSLKPLATHHKDNNVTGSLTPTEVAYLKGGMLSLTQFKLEQLALRGWFITHEEHSALGQTTFYVANPHAPPSQLLRGMEQEIWLALHARPPMALSALLGEFDLPGTLSPFGDRIHETLAAQGYLKPLQHSTRIHTSSQAATSLLFATGLVGALMTYNTSLALALFLLAAAIVHAFFLQQWASSLALLTPQGTRELMRWRQLYTPMKQHPWRWKYMDPMDKDYLLAIFSSR